MKSVLVASEYNFDDKLSNHHEFQYHGLPQTRYAALAMIPLSSFVASKIKAATPIAKQFKAFFFVGIKP